MSEKLDFTPVQEACEAYIAWQESADYHPDEEEDYEHAVFEAAMEAVYGKGIWDKLNTRTARFYEEEAKGRG